MIVDVESQCLVCGYIMWMMQSNQTKQKPDIMIVMATGMLCTVNCTAFHVQVLKTEVVMY